MDQDNNVTNLDKNNKSNGNITTIQHNNRTQTLKLQIIILPTTWTTTIPQLSTITKIINNTSENNPSPSLEAIHKTQEAQVNNKVSNSHYQIMEAVLWGQCLDVVKISYTNDNKNHTTSSAVIQKMHQWTLIVLFLNWP
jgi:hypothetical protein